MKKYFVFVLLIFISFTACNDSSLIEEKGLSYNSNSEVRGIQDVANKTKDVADEVLPLPSCLGENVVDSFLYFSNELTNYLLTEENINNFHDSTELANMLNTQGISTEEGFYQYVSSTWSIPLDIVKKYGFYSKKVAGQLSRETKDHHPIASRYYNLVKTGCLKSDLNPEIFEDDVFEVSMFRTKCPTFGDVMWSLFSAVISTAAAMADPNPITVGNAVKEIIDYGETISAC